MAYKPKSSLRVAHLHEFSTWDGYVYYINEQGDEGGTDGQTDEQGEVKQQVETQEEAEDNTALLAHITKQ